MRYRSCNYGIVWSTFMRFLDWLFGFGPEEQKMLDSMHKLCQEYDVHIGIGHISKTSKPEFVEKHRKELMDFGRRFHEKE